MAKVPEEKKPEANLPMVVDYGDDVGLGVDDIERGEYLIPFLRVLQANSPEILPVSAGGIDGAKAGMLINTATQELYDGEKGLVIIPCHRDHIFSEFVPRDAGGGFVGLRAPDDPTIQQLQAEQGKFGKLITKDGTELVETYSLYTLAEKDDGQIDRVVVGFTSTKIKVYQQFVTRAMSITYPNSSGNRVRPPLWAHKWRLSTTFSQNKKGSFFNLRLALLKEPPVESRMRLDDPVYIQGREFYDLIKSGLAKAAPPTPQETGGSAGGAADDEIPF